MEMRKLNQPKLNQHNQVGFNLIELMVAVSIISILLSIGIPSYIDSQKRNNADSHILKMKSAMNMAKQQAIYQARDIIMCPPNVDASACGTNWSNGAIIFALADAVSVANLTGISNDEIISRIYGVDTSVGSFTSNRNFYRFDRNGYAIAATNGTLTYCDASDNTIGQEVVVGTTGRIRLQDATSC